MENKFNLSTSSIFICTYVALNRYFQGFAFFLSFYFSLCLLIHRFLSDILYSRYKNSGPIKLFSFLLASFVSYMHVDRTHFVRTNCTKNFLSPHKLGGWGNFEELEKFSQFARVFGLKFDFFDHLLKLRKIIWIRKGVLWNWGPFFNPVFWNLLASSTFSLWKFFACALHYIDFVFLGWEIKTR